MQAKLTPEELVQFTARFGSVENNPGVPTQYLVPGVPEVQVIGNVRDRDGSLRAMFSKEAPLSDTGIQYDPERRTPVSSVLQVKMVRGMHVVDTVSGSLIRILLRRFGIRISFFAHQCQQAQYCIA